MNFNPFKEKCENLDSLFMDWEKMYPRPYDKCDADPYTRVRCILANGAEFEAVRFSHAFHRACTDNDIRRFLATTRRQEQQQQKRIACLKPLDETVLETTIGYEQLAVDLTAIFARRHQGYLKQAFDFALLEDFDHLYRYANLLELDTGIHAETLVGDYTEITPARPTVSEHRYPADDVRRFCDNSVATPLEKLDAAIITAAEQQTMNYYMNQAQFYTNDLGFFRDGELYVQGRIDDVAIIGGHNVSPVEVEDVISGCPLVADCACVKGSDPITGDCLVLFVVWETGGSDEDGLSSYMGEHLEPFKVPAYVRTLEEIPRTYNGKVDRKPLASLARELTA